MKLMRYARNANSIDQTGAITFVDDERPDVLMHGIGEFTDQEISSLTSMGMVLETVDDGGLEDKNVAELEKLAKKEGVELPDGAKKDEIVSALRAGIADSGEQRAAMAIGGTAVGVSGGPTGVSTGAPSTTQTSASSAT